MFEDSFRGFCDLVLPGTSYLERDGTTVNLEGRLQRQRRAVIAPCPDELAWVAKLAERFGVELSPHASTRLRGGLGDLLRRHPVRRGRRARRRCRRAPRLSRASRTRRRRSCRRATGCACSPTARSSPGPRSSARPSSQFQRPGGEIELARPDARARGIATGDTVTVSSNGTSRDAPRADRTRPARRHGPRAAGRRRGAPRPRRGEEVSHPDEVWWISLIKISTPAPPGEVAAPAASQVLSAGL